MSREWEQAGGRHDWGWESGQEAETAIQEVAWAVVGAYREVDGFKNHVGGERSGLTGLGCGGMGAELKVHSFTQVFSANLLCAGMCCTLGVQWWA